MRLAVLFLLGVAAAVILWRMFGRRDDRRVVPFPDKHPPVDVTPSTTLSALPGHQVVESDTPIGADIAGPMRRLGAIEVQQEKPPPSDRDDLKHIKGIGPKLEQVLHANGIFYFRQIADWQQTDVDLIDRLLPAFHGRIQREDWVGQARRLRDVKGSTE